MEVARYCICAFVGNGYRVDIEPSRAYQTGRRQFLRLLKEMEEVAQANEVVTRQLVLPGCEPYVRVTHATKPKSLPEL